LSGFLAFSSFLIALSKDSLSFVAIEFVKAECTDSIGVSFIKNGLNLGNCELWIFYLELFSVKLAISTGVNLVKEFFCLLNIVFNLLKSFKTLLGAKLIRTEL
jgi:hypothetical protein